MSDLYIIAAGKGSRMDANVPKALVKIVDEPCLTTTLKQIGSKFKNVFLITNVDVSNQWQDYLNQLDADYPELAQNVYNVPIQSGLGDGHAVLEGFKTLNSLSQIFHVNCCSDIVIAWGDVFFPQAEIIDELVSNPLRDADGDGTCGGFLPAVHKQQPYVNLLVDLMNRCTGVRFSKLGEHSISGFHDQSVFRFDKYVLWNALDAVHKAIWKADSYMTPSKEFSLLYAFHYLYNSGNAAFVYETKYPTLSFNTVEEVTAIQREIDLKWKSKFRK